MPYAKDGLISQAPIEGGIEIFSEQYGQALDGMLEGKSVSIVDGVLVIAFPPPPPEQEEPEEPEEPPEPTLEEARAAKLAELSDYRWQREIGGVGFAGITINTDGNSQQKIMAAYTLAKLDPGYSVSTWEVAPGLFMPLDNATIIAMGDVVRQHIQGTFDIKAVLYPQVLALETIEDIAAFDVAAEWDAAAGA